MKKCIEYTIVVIIPCLFLYLLGAFANATFDITLWSNEARSIIAIFMFFAVICMIMVYSLIKKNL